MSCLNLSKGHICFDFRYSNTTLWSLPSLLSDTWLDASTETYQLQKFRTCFRETALPSFLLDLIYMETMSKLKSSEEERRTCDKKSYRLNYENQIKVSVLLSELWWMLDVYHQHWWLKKLSVILGRTCVFLDNFC